MDVTLAGNATENASRERGEPTPRPAAPIGIFDSGLGGLTVARAVARALPGERLVYLGDTARVPYGTRSADTIVRYARSCGALLARHRIKMLVVACNTVSAVALDMLRVELDLPVLGVIEPGARAAVQASRSGRIAVIATSGTVASGAYPRAVASIDSRAEVHQAAAPLLVPLAEEGWLEGDVPRLSVRRYLEPLLTGGAAHAPGAQPPDPVHTPGAQPPGPVHIPGAQPPGPVHTPGAQPPGPVHPGIDTLVLGCTHYPLLSNVIAEEAARALGREIAVVDSGVAAAAELARELEERGLRALGSSGELRLMVTDRPARFAEVAARFLGSDLEGLEVEQVDL